MTDFCNLDLRPAAGDADSGQPTTSVDPVAVADAAPSQPSCESVPATGERAASSDIQPLLREMKRAAVGLGYGDALADFREALIEGGEYSELARKTFIGLLGRLGERCDRIVEAQR